MIQNKDDLVNIKTPHNGGKLLAKGSFGCVYKPALKCKGANERLDGYVSKLMLKKEALKEIEEQKNIDKLDPNYFFHLRIGKECVPEKPNITIDGRLMGCVLHGEKLNEIQKTDQLQKKYLIVHIEDGGIGLDKYMKEKNKMTNIKHCEMMLYDFTRLMYGLNEFSKKKMGHFDLKTGNIAYKEEENRFNFIDFGFTGTYGDFMNKHKNWGRTYWAHPIERMFAHYTERKVRDAFYYHIVQMAKTNKLVDELNNYQHPDFDYVKRLFKRYMVGYRNTFDATYVEPNNTYGAYGLNDKMLPSDTFVYDYIEIVREILKENKSIDEIINHFSKTIIEKLNTFSMSLVMIELIHTMMINQNNPKFKVVINYGAKNNYENEKNRNKITKVSPILAKFYDLMLKMNTPSFSKRISTKDAYDYYLNEIYTPLKQKYNLPDLEFINSPLNSTMTESLELDRSKLISDLQSNGNDNNINTTNSTRKTKNSGKNKNTPLKLKTKKRKLNIIRRDEKILNPLTGRYIKKYGQLARTLKKRQLIPKTSSNSNNLKTRKIPKKICLDGKILNPLTNRCIKKNGATYKKIKHKLK